MLNWKFPFISLKLAASNGSSQIYFNLFLSNHHWLFVDYQRSVDDTLTQGNIKDGLSGETHAWGKSSNKFILGIKIT